MNVERVDFAVQCEYRLKFDGARNGTTRRTKCASEHFHIRTTYAISIGKFFTSSATTALFLAWHAPYCCIRFRHRMDCMAVH